MSRVLGLLIVLLALGLAAGSGCGKKTPSSTVSGGTSSATTPGGADMVLEVDVLEVDLIPEGEPTKVKVTKGKAKDVEVPQDSGIKAKLEDSTVSLSAEKAAKAGDHEVTVKGDKKDAKIKVHVKAK
jgi:hypothetical protein